MFVVGLMAGVFAHSLGLIADSLDMLADALAYGLSLAAVSRGQLFKARVARLSGVLLLVLGLGVIGDAVRRAWQDGQPDGTTIIITAVLSLIVNAVVIRLLTKFKKGEVHLRAAWIFTRADVVANLGVILAGVLVLVVGSHYPDLIIGLAIGAYVVKEALEILDRARMAKNAATT